MKPKSKHLLLFVAMFFCVAMASAQEKKVSGTLRNETGNPIAGATYLVKNTKTGGTTDENGNFSVLVKGPKAILVFSSVNFKSKEVSVGENSVLNVTLTAADNNLTEVVVTALGIQKTKKSLGYAVQEVKGSSLVEAREVNVVNDLSGKVAGLQITRSGNGPGGSSKITLRGNNSLTGDNQPLIVVDGIPMQNSTGRVGIGGTNDFYNPSLDMGNGLSDINPDDIATLTVLKGPAASALYGSRAGNGVILITTKTGRKEPGLGITVSSSIGFSSIFTNPAIQNSFGQGSNGLFNPTSLLSWGPKIEGQIDTAWNGEAVPLKAYNNVKNFFQTGITSTQNISFQQQIQFRLYLHFLQPFG